MPTKAPPSITRPTEPAAQPTTAPIPTLAAVTPPSNAPAPAGSNEERGLGSIAPSITNLVTVKIGSTSAFFGDFVHGRIGAVRVVLIHGSGGNAEIAWAPVQPLAVRYTLVAPNRGGYPPNPILERIDFEQQAGELAPLLEDGAHLVGHSYGGVIERLVARLAEHLDAGPTDPREFAQRFMAIVGSDATLPEELSPEMEQGIRATTAERRPWEAEIPLAELAAAPFPKLVISGGHSAAFDAVCDVLEERLDAERAVLPGAGHGLARAPGYVERLDALSG